MKKISQCKHFMKSNDSLYCDFMITFVRNYKNIYKHILYLDGTFVDNVSPPNNYSFTCTVTFSIVINGSMVITNVNITNVIIKKDNNNECDFESNLYCIINNMMTHSNVTSLKNKFILNLILKNNNDCLLITSLDSKLSNHNMSIIKNEISSILSKDSPFEISAYFLIIIYLVLFIMPSKNNLFDKSNLLFFKLRKSITKFLTPP